MEVATGIKFEQFRQSNTKSASGDIAISAASSMQILPPLGIHELIIDSRAVKVYFPYQQTKSIYVQTGVEGPVIKLVGSYLDMANYSLWEEVYANDYLEVKEFDYPIYNGAISSATPNNQWWVDTIEVDSQSGWRAGNAIRYVINLNLYKKSDW